MSVKLWHPCFNAKDEFMKATLVSVEFLILLREMWSNRSREEIWDTLGKFILFGNSYKASMESLVAITLVEIDFNQGRFESLVLPISKIPYT